MARKPKVKKTAMTATASSVVIPQFLTLGETADALRLSVPTISRLVYDGELRAFRTGLGGRMHVYVDSILEFIERNTVERKRVAAGCDR